MSKFSEFIEKNKDSTFLMAEVTKVIEDGGFISADTFNVRNHKTSDDFVYASEFDETDGIKIIAVVITAFFVKVKKSDHLHVSCITEMVAPHGFSLNSWIPFYNKLIDDLSLE